MKALLLSLTCLLPVALAAQTPTPSPTATPYEPYTFRTLAGVAGGSQNGTGAAARFRFPQGAAIDQSGNVYIGDSGNSIIRKITPAGAVTTFAGAAGVSGSVDGAGSAARFASPNGLVFDNAGTLYVADSNAVRKITPSGDVSTLVGGSIGTGDAPPFSLAYGIVIDGTTGNLYVTDSLDCSVRKITPAGVMTLLAGGNGPGFQDGQGTNASFNEPAGLTINTASQALFVGDAGNQRLRVVGFDGQTSTLPFDNFGAVYGLVRDASGTIFVADATTNMVEKISGNTVSPIAGSYVKGSEDGTGSAAKFYAPRGIALAADGTLYVVDTSNCTIRKITPSNVVTTVAGFPSPGSGDGIGSTAHFDHPTGVAVDKKTGSVYVADNLNRTIRKITAAGKVTTLAGKPGYSGNVDGTSTVARFGEPVGVAVDGSGVVYVADRSNSSVRKITPTGTVSTLEVFLSGPEGVAVDKAGNLYIANTLRHTIVKRSSKGQVTTFAGIDGFAGHTDGDATNATFNQPAGIAVDANGVVYVADTRNNCIRKITPGGTVTTLPGFFFRTKGVAVDNEENVFASDPIFTWTVSKISPAGEVTIVGGLAGTIGSKDGSGSEVRFWSPAGLATDAAGRVYVADRSNNTIRVGAPATTAINISTRMQVGTDPDELIAGFIVTGNVPKKVIIRALGPSLQVNGQPVPGTLQDTTLELHGDGGLLIRSNDNWNTDQEQEIAATGIAPKDTREAALIDTLQPGNYTAIVRGKGSSTGIGLVEVYDLAVGNDAQMAQISTRGKVLPDGGVMIGGFILSGGAPVNVLVRAIGPELSGAADPLMDPTLKLYNSSGTAVAENDDWRSTQEQAITKTGVPPKDDREAAILKNLAPGSYTAIVAGKDNASGVALVEVYVLH